MAAPATAVQSSCVPEGVSVAVRTGASSPEQDDVLWFSISRYDPYSACPDDETYTAQVTAFWLAVAVQAHAAQPITAG